MQSLKDSKVEMTKKHFISFYSNVSEELKCSENIQESVVLSDVEAELILKENPNELTEPEETARS